MGKTGEMRGELAGVVPCYNAGGRLRGVLERVSSLLDNVVVVNDGSTDRGCDHLADLKVRLVNFDANRGKGFALMAGFREASVMPGIRGVVTLDADGQHDPEELPSLFGAFERENADLVIGSRVFDGQRVPWRSRFGNTMTIPLASLLLGRRFPDTQSGYRIHSMRLVRHILDAVRGGRYETEMEILVRAVRDGFVVASIPIHTIYEAGNRSSHFSVARDSVRIWGKLLSKGLFARSGRRCVSLQ